MATRAATSSSPPPATVVPAQLGFLAIFNPTLGTTDDTMDDQIVYYTSVNTDNTRRRVKSRSGKPTENISNEERNERLRQIGLAQGMVEFSRGFAGGYSVDTIETEKSRVVLHELEPGWWIIASIDLTKLPLPPRLGKSKGDASENVEYSSREVKPAVLLLQDLLRAHYVFLLHHAASLSALFVRCHRPKSVAMLSRYWDLFLSTWNVMLHGNPACAVLGGIKIAACGELGMGVGEEERGSGEREVLEGFVDGVEGLVDLVVSKFGEAEPETCDEKTNKDNKSDDTEVFKWLGTGEEPGAEDGAIFLGVGALSRNSLRDLTYWMEDLYTWGEDAYGVRDSPTATRVKAKRRRVKLSSTSNESSVEPTLGAAAEPEASKEGNSQGPPTQLMTESNGSEAVDEGGMNKFMSYLKMGYGTHWTIGSSGTASEYPSSDSATKEPSPPDGAPAPPSTRKPSEAMVGNAGHYLIGLKGDVEERENNGDSGGSEADSPERGSRTLVRTVTVELESEAQIRTEANTTRDFGSHTNELSVSQWGRRDSSDPTSCFDSQDRNKAKKMRVVVYVSKPFMYTFIFQNRTDSLAWDSLYKSLHYQLAPLRKALTVSTSYRPDKPEMGSNSSHIFDLIWDPWAMTMHSTIPSIPDPASKYRQDGMQASLPWSRVEALNTHLQILTTYAATRMNKMELERTCKTSRGWWVVWTRIMDGTPPTDQTRKPTTKPKVAKEILLIRRAGEHGATGLRGVSASYEDGYGSGGWADGASRLAQGIGVDTKKYIESLLSLGR